MPLWSRRAASPAVTVDSSRLGSVRSGSQASSSGSNPADTPRSSTSHASSSSANAAAAAPTSFGPDHGGLTVPKSMSKKKDKSIAAGLLAAAPASSAAAGGAAAAVSPWSGYLDPASISTPATPKVTKKKKTTKRSGTISAKKSTKKSKPNAGAGPETDTEQQQQDSDDLYEDHGQLETFFPMAKAGDAHKQLGYLRPAVNGQRSQKESLGVARFSVGGMLDMVDQKMQKEEQQEQAKAQQKQTVLSPMLLRPSISEMARALRANSPGPSPNSPLPVASARQDRGRVSPFPTDAGAAQAKKPSNSSQDAEEVLSPIPSSNSTQSTRRRSSSASSAASEAATLRDEVRELLAVAKRAAAMPYVRDSVLEPVRERQRTRSASEDGPRPAGGENWQIVNNKVPASSGRPASPAPSKAGTIWRPHYGAFRGPFPHRKAKAHQAEAIPPVPSSASLNVPARAGHHRKRSMSVPSAFQVPGYKATFGIALSEAGSGGAMCPPKRYDESFFSSPKKALQPVRELETQSFIELDSSNESRSSTALPSPSVIESMLASALPKEDDAARRHGRARTAAGHPAARAAPMPATPTTVSASKAQLAETDHSHPKEARSRSNSDTSVLDPYSPFQRRQRALDRSTGASSALPPLGASASSASSKAGLVRSPKDRSLAARAAKLDEKMDRYWQSRLGDADLPVPKKQQQPKASRSSIGPPPRSPLPSLPVPQNVAAGEERARSPNLLLPAQMPLPVSRSASPMPSADVRLQARSPSPSSEALKRAVSPTLAYSKDGRPRPRNIPVVNSSRTPSPLPVPSRPAPAPPLVVQPAHLQPQMERPRQGVNPAGINTPSPLVQLQRQPVFPPAGPPIAIAQERKVRPDTQMTFDSIASYYGDEHDSPAFPAPVPQSPYVRGSPQFSTSPASSCPAMPFTPDSQHRPAGNVVRNVSSSSTLASSRPSMSMDGSHDTHVSLDSAITTASIDEDQVEHVRASIDSTQRGQFSWTRFSPPRKDSLPGRGLASALREKAIAEQQEALLKQQMMLRKDDEGYLGSPEQSEELRLHGGNEIRRESNASSTASRERISQEYQYNRTRTNYSIPIRHARHA